MDEQKFWDEVFMTYARQATPAAVAVEAANLALAARREALRWRAEKSSYTITRECSVEEASHGE